MAKSVKVQVWKHTWGGKQYKTLVIGDRRVAGLEMINPVLESEFTVLLDDLRKASKSK